MKALILILIIAATACFNDRNAPPEITGKYTHDYKDEFSRSYDTLIISRLQKRANAAYQIQKISNRQKTWENTALPAKRKLKQWQAAYEPQTQSIELEPGLCLFFNINAGEAILGSQSYKKIH